MNETPKEEAKGYKPRDYSGWDLIIAFLCFFVLSDILDATAKDRAGHVSACITSIIISAFVFHCSERWRTKRSLSRQKTSSKLQKQSQIGVVEFQLQNALLDLPTPPSKEITGSERLALLSRFYAVQKAVAFYNLESIKIEKKPDKMKAFPIEGLTSLISYVKEGKTITLLFGEILGEKLDFKPTITDKILNLHSNINFINAAINTGPLPPRDGLVRPLQQILMDSFFLQETFLYGSKKAAFIGSDLKKMLEKKVELKAIFDDYIASYKAGLKGTIQCVIDANFLKEQLNAYRFADFNWVGKDVTGTGKVLNGYLLPFEVVEGLKKQMAKFQADAMAKQHSPGRGQLSENDTKPRKN